MGMGDPPSPCFCVDVDLRLHASACGFVDGGAEGWPRLRRERKMLIDHILEKGPSIGVDPLSPRVEPLYFFDCFRWSRSGEAFIRARAGKHKKITTGPEIQHLQEQDRPPQRL